MPVLTMEAESKTGTHDAAKGRHAQAQLQVELANASQLLVVRKLLFLRDARGARKQNSNHADGNAHQDNDARTLLQQLHELSVKDGRNKRAEDCRVSERDRHTQ